MNIDILILAAGEATRMGKAKQLLPFHNSTILEYTINQALSSRGKKVYCVLGANSEVIKKQVKVSSVDYIDNPDWRQGLSSSIVSGIKHIQSKDDGAEAVLIMLADQPFVEPSYINSLIDTYIKKSGCIVASDYGSKMGVPAIFPVQSFEFLLELKGDKGAKELLNGAIFEVVLVMPVGENTLKDIDTLSDYNSLLNN